MGKSTKSTGKLFERPAKSVERIPEQQSVDHAQNPQKLTKQQKRDLKRNQKAQSHYSGALQVKSSSSSISAYKRDTVYPRMPSKLAHSALDRFIEPSDTVLYNELLASSYEGFVTVPSENFDEKFHEIFESSLAGLDAFGAFQFDITQPAGLGTKLAQTLVTRCLVGEAGVTYKYLGIRMFSIPWNQEG